MITFNNVLTERTISSPADCAEDEHIIERLLERIKSNLLFPDMENGRPIRSAVDSLLGWKVSPTQKFSPTTIIRDHFERRLDEPCPLWEKLKEKLRKHHVNAKLLVTPTWVTGTQSPALIGIAEVANTALSSGRPALVPTGILLNHRIVPLTGELGLGFFGVNNSSLSGAIIREASTAVDYAKGDYLTDFKQVDTQISLNYILKSNNYSSFRMLKVHLLRYLKLRSSNDDLEKITEKIKNLLSMEQPSNIEKKTQYQELLDLVQNVNPYQLDKTSYDFLTSRFPIVWGAQIDNQELVSVRAGCWGERIVTRSLTLGVEEGITSVFCKKKDKQALSNWLKDCNVNLNVHSLKTLHYLALRDILKP